MRLQRKFALYVPWSYLAHETCHFFHALPLQPTPNCFTKQCGISRNQEFEYTWWSRLQIMLKVQHKVHATCKSHWTCTIFRILIISPSPSLENNAQKFKPLVLSESPYFHGLWYSYLTKPLGLLLPVKRMWTKKNDHVVCTKQWMCW
jgi:hypothetical protein